MSRPRHRVRRVPEDEPVGAFAADAFVGSRAAVADVVFVAAEEPVVGVEAEDAVAAAQFPQGGVVAAADEGDRTENRVEARVGVLDDTVAGVVQGVAVVAETPEHAVATFAAVDAVPRCRCPIEGRCRIGHAGAPGARRWRRLLDDLVARIIDAVAVAARAAGHHVAAGAADTDSASPVCVLAPALAAMASR